MAFPQTVVHVHEASRRVAMLRGAWNGLVSAEPSSTSALARGSGGPEPSRHAAAAWTSVSVMFRVVVAGLLFALWCPITVYAQDGQKSKSENATGETKPASKKSDIKADQKPDAKGGKGIPRIDAEHEALALAFAAEHHPELAALLEQLKENNRREYAKAVQELHQSRERLVRIKERQPDIYEYEIESWKLTSRIRLLSARMTMAEDDASLEQDLEKLLKTRGELQVRRLQVERDRVAARLTRLDQDLAAAKAKLEGGVGKEVSAVKSQVAKEKIKVKKSGKVVNKTPAKTVKGEAPSATAVKPVPPKTDAPNK